MKINKFFYGVMIAILLVIFGYHYKLNYNIAIEPPSKKWAKEVLIADGDIKGFPSITKFQDSYKIAFNNGDNIKILSVDAVGKVFNQGSIMLNGQLPRDINIFVNGNTLFLCYIVSGADGGELSIITLDENLAPKVNTTIVGLKDYVRVNDNTIAAVYKEKIDLINLTDNKITTVVTQGDTALASSVGYGNKDCIVYSSTFGDMNYFFLENGVVSDTKVGGVLSEYSKVKFRNMISILNKDVVTNLIEYIYNSDYIGYKYISFSLENGELINRGEFPIKYEGADKGYIYNGAGISIAAPVVYKDVEGRMLISSARDVAKAKSQTDILEMELQGKLGVMMEPVSRTKSVSINPGVYKDTVVFLDPIKDGYGKLYMTSSREDFKAINNKNRPEEAMEALIQNFEGLLFSFAYLVTYGMIWIIPAISVFSILSLLEYKWTYGLRKAVFIIAYILGYVLKVFVVKTLSYSKFSRFLPPNFTFTTGLLSMGIISIVCLVYGYINYKEDLEKNVMALSYSKPIFIDSLLTLALFVGFLK